MNDKTANETTKPTTTKPVKLPVRFYKTVTIKHLDNGYSVLLDERPIKTPKRKAVEVNSQSLAKALKTEWETQQTHIDPETMPLTKLVNTALDGITGSEIQVASDIAQYACSDAICYRAVSPPDLVTLQNKAWDPLIKWSRQELGITLKTTTGVMPVDQPRDTADKAADILMTFDPLQLGAIHVLTTMTGSLMITLALARGRLNQDEAWDTAHIDEDYQLRKWGADAEALARLAWRRKEFNAALKLHELLN